MSAFTHELEKLAVGAHLARATIPALAARLGGSSTRGAIIGAGLGALGGLESEVPEGDSRLRRAARGLVAGGIGGAAAGGLTRTALDYRLLHPGAGTLQTAGGVARVLGKSAKNFGKRQLHGITGAYADDAARIGMPSSGLAAKQEHLAKLRSADRARMGDTQAAAGLEQRVKDIRHSGAEGDRRLKAGITSIPGAAKGLAQRPVHTLKEMAHASFGGSPVGAAVALGLPTAMAVPGLRAGDESATGGPTMGRKLTMLGTNLAGGVLTGGMPVLPNVLTGAALDKLVAYKPMRPSVQIPGLVESGAR